MFKLIFLFVFTIPRLDGLSSPLATFTQYNHSVELKANVSDLWWTVNDVNQTVLFELHTKTTGWIALGISPAGGMAGADIGVGWVDSNGIVYFQDRYASTEALPMIDNTTQNWFALQGRESNGWTAIQFTRLIDTCDYMDVPIETGTNYLIFAYGLVDPSLTPPISDITYHEDRRGEAILSLLSYNDLPLESEFAQYDHFDFQINNYTIPSNDTTYFCQVFRVPANYTTKVHSIANKIILNSTDLNLVHHLLMYECDTTSQFDDSNLPIGLCDSIGMEISTCVVNIATGWAVGGQTMLEFPSEAGYPMGGNATIKYFLLQMHYNNPNLYQNNVDNSGIRFYVTKQLRQYDIGYLTFGTDASPFSLSIPAQVQNFIVDSYCPMNASSLIPSTGIKIINAFPHTHLQGKTVWTKLIRNKTAVQYLFDAEAYDFNYQFNHRLDQPIQLYPGDEFSTRCIYNTMNKNTTTFGGESTRQEMCLHMFTYYPRIDEMSACLSTITDIAWEEYLNLSNLTSTSLQTSIETINWTSNLTKQWQNFYNNAPRYALFGRSSSITVITQAKLPEYTDLPVVNCTPLQISSTSTITASPFTTTSTSTSTTTSSSTSVSHRKNISIFIFVFSCYLFGFILKK